MFEHVHAGFHDAFPFLFLSGLSHLLWLALIALLILGLIRWATRNRVRWWQPMAPYIPHTPPFQGQPFGTHAAEGPRPEAPIHQPSALDILNRRYANGEIDEATFENMRERILASQRPEQTM